VTGRPRVAIGRVGRPHGLDGAFVVEHGSDDERRYAVGAILFLDGEPAGVIASRRVGGGRHAIKLDREAVRGQELSIPRDTLPPPDTDHYYVADLVGLRVETDAGTDVGEVVDVLPGVANDCLSLSGGQLVPLVEAAICSIDLEARRVVVAGMYVEVS
jgi:16S rRNA processing protein RimM